MQLKDIPQGSKVFVDVNVLLYDIGGHPTFGPICKAFLKRIRQGELEGCLSVEVLNELLYRLVIAEVAKKQNLGLQGAGSHIKRNTQVLATLEAYKTLTNVENIPNLRVVGVLPSDFVQARSLMQQHSLLSNDALHVAVMQRENLDLLASKDSDFRRVPWVKLYQP